MECATNSGSDRPAGQSDRSQKSDRNYSKTSGNKRSKRKDGKASNRKKDERRTAVLAESLAVTFSGIMEKCGKESVQEICNLMNDEDFSWEVFREVTEDGTKCKEISEGLLHRLLKE